MDKLKNIYRLSKENTSSKEENHIRIIIEFVKIIFLATIFAIFVTLFIFEVVIVDGRSMEPTLHDNDRIVVEKLSYYIRKPTYNDIIVFRYPVNPAIRFIKRVIAVEGDRIKIKNSKVYLNGNIKNEPYILEQNIEDFNETIVPKDTVFVLGDNRNKSKDSRQRDVGFVNLKLINGRAVYKIYPIKAMGRIR
jgi:signal peptidase I